MNWWSLSLVLSGWQVWALQRPSRLAPLLAVSDRNLSINLAWGLHCSSRWSLQAKASAPFYIREGRSRGWHRRQKPLSVPNQNLCVHHWKLFSSGVSMTSVTTTKWAIKISRKKFVCLLLMLRCFSVAEGPLVKKMMVSSEGFTLPY